MDRRTFMTGLAVAPAAALLMPHGGPVTTPEQPPFVTESGRQFRLLSGAIRNSGTGWTFIDDAAHRPSGFTGLVQHPTYLDLLHPVGARMVSSFQVTPDEAFASRGLRVGASVGLDHTLIYMYTAAPVAPAADPAGIVATTGNLWLTGYLEI
jgi:hypothetical protein